ncbi:coiled-coil domain-containing protein 153-like [Sinocyclocheilus rhinocerous]|uniref:coiled-coil domain-containing protein 153-like n=1 Tax=Sinocyclocheilus rhinocerous TaxID=307959 RepID=UPI0007B8FD7A|nr:PREDICTED: coiled-coil domain-containing protein 153-like [Sinocyclocheilus rhinocerous]
MLPLNDLYLNRQYKSVETDLQTKANRLEVSVDLLEMQLAECQVKLNSEREQREKTEAEKDAIISDLQSKLDSMERECEKILHGCLDSLLSHLAETQLQWEEQSTVLHQEVKDTLSDFGINPLHTDDLGVARPELQAIRAYRECLQVPHSLDRC